MSSSKTFDMAMFGHLAKDRNVIDGKGEICAGGAVYYGSVALRHIGLSVAVVTRLHPDDYGLLDEIRAEGVTVFAKAAQQTSGIENRYNSADMERRTCKPLGFAGPIQLDDIPDLAARIYAIAPIIAGEVDLAVVEALAARGPVALDIQGFVRVPVKEDLVFRPWPDMDRGLTHVTFLKVDRAEAEHLTGETDLEQAVKRLAAYGPREIVLTQSSGVTVFADGKFCTAPFTPRSLAGRTGRGDTCFSSYLARRLTAAPEEACRFAAAVTTLKQEKPGPWRGTIAEVEAVMAQHAARRAA